MKKLTKIFAAFVVVFLLSISGSFAQDGHYYVVTTWKIQIPKDGSNAELNQVMKEFHDKVLVKNDKVISQKILRHAYGNDMRDLVVVSEYANWNDIHAAGDVSNKLIEAAWPDKDARKKYFDSFWKYVVTHSDEILLEKPELTK